jgi:hypothetical protein
MPPVRSGSFTKMPQIMPVSEVEELGIIPAFDSKKLIGEEEENIMP